eukprot:scaffold317670_cov26-Tisochrysis_lutea.AAC.1
MAQKAAHDLEPAPMADAYTCLTSRIDIFGHAQNGTQALSGDSHRDAAALAQAVAHDLKLAPMAAAAAGVSTTSNPDCCTYVGDNDASNLGGFAGACAR